MEVSGRTRSKANGESTNSLKDAIIQKVAALHTKIKSMIAAQIADTTVEFVSKELGNACGGFPGNHSEMRDREARTGLCSIAYSAVQQILFDLFRWELRNEIPNNQITKYFDTSDAADKLGGKLQYANALMATNATYIQSRAGESSHAECITKNM